MIRQSALKGLAAPLLCLLVIVVVLTLFQNFKSSTRNYGGLLWQAKRKGLVMATQKSDNMTWLKDAPHDWQVFNYVLDDRTARLSVPRDQGREAIAYITYVIDHYDRLPDYIAFTHGHETSWHQPEQLTFLIKALNLAVLDEMGWVSLRCSLQNTCEGPDRYVRPYKDREWDMNALLIEVHKFVHRHGDSWYQPLPEEFAVPCCGQFAVTKKQVLSMPREYWQRLQMALMQDYDQEVFKGTVGIEDSPISLKLGGVFETSWPWWFGIGSVVCLDEEYCRDTVFQGKIHCTGTAVDLPTAESVGNNVTCTFNE